MVKTLWEGLDRVVEPLGSSPYDAWRLDADRPLSAREVVITVERLNLDATSFADLYEHHGGDTRSRSRAGPS
jgi:L-erythro-3,5-diaminohexanoate dehydrogenase